MTAPQISIIIPHKPTPSNNRALELNLAMLLANSSLSHEIIIDTECPKDPYKIWNEAAATARAEVLIFTNSDVLQGPGWDMPYYQACEPNTIVTGYLVEAGNIGVASVNIFRDFGRTPEAFQRKEFEVYARLLATTVPPLQEQRGWYMPCAVQREWFLSTGGFDTRLGFPNPNDILFWEMCISQYKTRLLRVNSVAYHFQALSSR